MTDMQKVRKPFPAWLKKPIGVSGKKTLVEQTLRDGSLHTVCEEAGCPNRTECFSCGTATFLVMGDICTRNCLFCSVNGGVPLALDKKEPQRILDAVLAMNLSYVVITSVTRDDLADGGSLHIAEIVELLTRSINEIKVEVLVPDFGGNENLIMNIIKSKPFVFNHNIETVRSVFDRIRPEADFDRSLEVLRFVKSNSDIPVKTGFMVGLGETVSEVESLIDEVQETGVSILTIGQYLQPSRNQVPVVEFINPEQFSYYSNYAKKRGIQNVFSGPFVRSSYKAAEAVSAR